MSTDGIDWKAAAEGERSCVSCGHSRNSHDVSSGECFWHYFSFWTRCRCRAYDGGNIWPRITIPAHGSVEAITITSLVME